MSSSKSILIAAPIPERIQNGQKILIITGDKTEDLEFFYPYYRFCEAGYDVTVATIDGKGFEGKKGYGLDEVQSVSSLNASDFALLYLPGGEAPEALRKNDDVINFVKEFAQSGKPIAAICHGPQILATAGLIDGLRIAGWPEIKGELEEAGATFVDEALVKDGQFITGRKPGDLHRHMDGVFITLRQGSNAPRNSQEAA